MSTQCNTNQLEFLPFKTPRTSRTLKVTGRFDADKVSSDGGIALLRETEHRFRDDPIARMFCERSSPLAGKSTINRMELTTEEGSRYKKVEADFCAMDRLLVDMFLRFHKKNPKKIKLDIDVTDDPLHGNQEGKFYHGCYGEYCYAPSYIFCGRHLLGCRLREANRDSAAGAVEEVERIVSRIRGKWETTRIIIRGDAGFCREELMRWCEENGADYVLGMARNSRLMKRVGKEARKAHVECRETGKAARRFKSFRYCTKKSWSRNRRVVCKAEHLEKGANTRFVVTSLKSEEYDARTLYERVYCARGEMENRIKAQQLDLFSDRTSTHYMRSNQLRMYFSAFAYMLLECLRRSGLKGTRHCMAQCGTIRVKLLKVGALIRQSARRVLLSFAESCPYGDLFRHALRRLQAIPLAP